MLTVKEKKYGLAELWNAVNDKSTWDFDDKYWRLKDVKHLTDERKPSLRNSPKYYLIYNKSANKIRIDCTHAFDTVDDIYFGDINWCGMQIILKPPVGEPYISKNKKVIKDFIIKRFYEYQNELFDLLPKIEQAKIGQHHGKTDIVNDVILAHKICWESLTNAEILNPIINIFKLHKDIELQHLNIFSHCLEQIEPDDTLKDVKENFDDFSKITNRNLSLTKIGVRIKIHKIKSTINSKL